MYKDNTLMEYIQAIDSVQPAPGGGSAAGLVGALGTALARMYGHLSINKKKFAALPEDKKNSFIENFEKLTVMEQSLCDAIDRDAQAYECVMSAYRMKHETEEESALRQQAIHQATLEAIQPPMDIMVQSAEALRLCRKLAADGNKSVISDLAIGVIYLAGAAESSSWNVMINLSSLSDTDKTSYEKQMNALLEESTELKKEILCLIKQRMEE